MIEQLYIIALGSAHSALILPQYGIADPGELTQNSQLIQLRRFWWLVRVGLGRMRHLDYGQ